MLEFTFHELYTDTYSLDIDKEILLNFVLSAVIQK